MTRFKKLKLTILVIILAGCAHHEIGIMQFPEGETQHAIRGDSIDWSDCPPHLPKGCQLSILEGNPKKPDLFTVRFKLDDIFFMPPHTHPKDERVTILEGNVSVAFGEDATYDDAIHFGPGDYYVNARNSIHTVWIDKPTILQITGIGPWQANFISDNPALDTSHK